MKNLKIPLFLALLSALLFHFSNSSSVVGRLVNNVFPCEQDLTSSFPCYAGWDIGAMIFAGVVFVVSVAWAGFVLIRK